MKTNNLLKFKLITSIFIFIGIAINIYVSILVIPAEFGVIILFLTFPSSILLFSLWLIIFFQKNSKNYSKLLSSLFIGLLIPMLFSIIVFRELKIVLNTKKRQWRSFYRDNIAPVENGKWFYPDKENPLQILNFKNGKMDGEQVEFLSHTLNPSQDSLNRQIEYFSSGKRDSISRFINGNLIYTEYDSNFFGDNLFRKQFTYDDDKLIKIIIDFRAKDSDTIFVKK